MTTIVLSRYQTSALPAYCGAPTRIMISPDLGLSRIEATLGPDGLQFPDGEHLDWEAIKEISSSENNCFTIKKGRLEKIVVFSATTNRACSLMPTAGAPTMLVAGFTMHRIKGCDPYQDTLAKMKAISPLRGVVLDTATGLGYTAIEAAKTAEQVHTVELDPAAQEVARQNPWSRELFDNPKITQYLGDSFELVDSFSEAMFDRIIHDPPVFSLAGQLYGGEFYRKLYRVLRKGGRLFHYIGNPASRAQMSITHGVIARLREAGFARTKLFPQAFGVVADK